jgi:hypothetical protein
MTLEAQTLNEQTENQDDSGDLQLPLKGTCAEHKLTPFQHFAPFRLATLCTSSWQPLEMHDVLFAFSPGIKSGSAVCTAPSSNERVPPWQCRHSRLLYGSQSLMFKHFRAALEEVGVKAEKADKFMKRFESKRGRF